MRVSKTKYSENLKMKRERAGQTETYFKAQGAGPPNANAQPPRPLQTHILNTHTSTHLHSLTLALSASVQTAAPDLTAPFHSNQLQATLLSV